MSSKLKPIFYLIFGAYAALWLTDAWFSYNLFKLQVGAQGLNPVMHNLFEHLGTYSVFYGFGIICCIFGAINLWMDIHPKRGLALCCGALLLQSWVVLHNFNELFLMLRRVL